VDSHIEKFRLLSDFRVATNLGVAVVALILLTPFAVNNFYQGRYLLGVGSLAIVALLAVNAWTTSRGRYHASLVLVGLLPAVIFFLMVAFRQQGMIGALWCYPAAISFYFMLPERSAWLANAALLGVAIPQAWSILEHPLALRVAVTLLAVSTFAAIFVRVITVQQRKLHDHAVTDPLTGLANRVLLNPTLERAVQQSRRSGTPMSLATLDLDHFKSINDTLGHDAGDTVRHAVESLPLLPDRPVTASLGLATLEADEDWKEWMKRADENLYRAKAAGRNRVAA
jgi:GGDEF domain-containing protein